MCTHKIMSVGKIHHKTVRNVITIEAVQIMGMVTVLGLRGTLRIIMSNLAVLLVVVGRVNRQLINMHVAWTVKNVNTNVS